MENYEQIATIMKALADPKRLKMLTYFLQLTLFVHVKCWSILTLLNRHYQHHMKLLEKAGIVKVTKKSQWHHYALQEDFC